MGFGNATTGQKHIENYLNQSLKNLGLDYDDLYIYHMWDYNTPMEEVMDGTHLLSRMERLSAAWRNWRKNAACP